MINQKTNITVVIMKSFKDVDTEKITECISIIYLLLCSFSFLSIVFVSYYRNTNYHHDRLLHIHGFNSKTINN